MCITKCFGVFCTYKKCVLNTYFQTHQQKNVLSNRFFRFKKIQRMGGKLNVIIGAIKEHLLISIYLRPT